MVKIKWMDREAELQENGTWQSKNKSFEGVLNEIATPKQITRYVPDIDAELIELARAQYPDLEVFDYNPLNPDEEPEEENTPY